MSRRRSPKGRRPLPPGQSPVQPVKRPSPPRRSMLPRALAATVLGALVVGLPGYLLLTSGDPDAQIPTSPRAPIDDTDVSTEPSAAPGSARSVFIDTCGACHALADAGTGGGFGPPLDGSRLTRAQVLAQIRQGSPSGQMPANLLEGVDAERVAAYVARVARPAGAP